MAIDSFDPSTGVPDSVPFLLTEFRTTPGTPNTYAVKFYFPTNNADGEEVGVRQGTLIPHLPGILTAAEITGLKGIHDKILAAAQATIP